MEELKPVFLVVFILRKCKTYKQKIPKTRDFLFQIQTYLISTGTEI